LNRKSFLHYLLHLADNALILGHRNSEWCGHGPALEQDIAITNIALDLIGQARNFYQYAAEIINASKEKDTDKNAETEDTLAYLRDAIDFKNCLLVEQSKGDWAVTTLRQFLFSYYQYFLYKELKKSADPQVAAIAEKSLKEVTYHVKWGSEWVIRLGDGTNESHTRMVNAVQELWRFTGELFMPASYEAEMVKQGIGVDVNLIKDKWMQKVTSVLEEATLQIPADVWMQTGGKEGKHSEQLGYILAEMQFLQRAYPNAEW
jgi:ring-1,2-phenylacetyl-CoA epoxidase subunit PaaC